MKHDEFAGFNVPKGRAKPDEQLLVAKAIDSAYLCIRKQACVFTDFLDPGSVKTVIGSTRGITDAGTLKFGGHICCERQIICFYPSYMDVTVETAGFPIKALYIDSSKFINSLTHRDFLGALIGLGLDRRKLGDIFEEDGNAAVFVHSTAADFILNTLTSVGRAKVRVSELSDGFSPYQKSGKTRRVTVASMRADAVLGEAFNLSRSKAAELIRAEKVFVNWEIMSAAPREIKEGDVISLRGYGRAEIKGISGKSKKGRIMLEVERY